VPPGADPAALPPPQPIDELWAFLTNPLLLTFAAVFAAWVASRLVVAQVEDMRLDGPERGDGEPRFRWSALFGALSFWAVLTLGLLGVASHAELGVVARFLEAGFDILLRAAVAAAILAGAASYARIVAGDGPAPDDPEANARARSEQHMILLIGGVLAVAAVTGLRLMTWLLLAALGAPALVLLKSERARKRVAEVLHDLAAGLQLRGEVRRGARVEGGGRTLKLSGELGLVHTWVREGGQRQLLRNSLLLEVVTGAGGGASSSVAAAEAVEEDDEDPDDA